MQGKFKIFRQIGISFNYFLRNISELAKSYVTRTRHLKPYVRRTRHLKPYVRRTRHLKPYVK